MFYFGENERILAGEKVAQKVAISWVNVLRIFLPKALKICPKGKKLQVLLLSSTSLIIIKIFIVYCCVLA